MTERLVLDGNEFSLEVECLHGEKLNLQGELTLEQKKRLLDCLLVIVKEQEDQQMMECGTRIAGLKLTGR